jgi:hypothetical protein
MSPSLSRIPARVRFGVSLALSSALLLSCGGNPAGAPGAGAANLPPQTNPAVKDDKSGDKAAQGPRRTLTGSVVDALTGEPVGKAVMYIEGLETSAVSTPTPAASPDGRDPVDTEGGGGGPAAPFQLSQAGSPAPTLASPSLGSPVPGASGSPDGFPAPDGSLSPGTSPAPGAASPGAGSSPAAGTSPAPGAASPAAAAPGKDKDKPAAPTAKATPVPLKTMKVDSRGKYEMKELPEGTYSITFWAPGYQAQTFQGGLRSTLDVQLVPLALPKTNLHDLKGVVRQAGNEPAGNVEVEATSYKAHAPGAHASTDDAGNFGLKGLLAGNYAVAAWTTGLDGDINTFALVKEVPVAVGREKRTVSPTLVLRAVTAPVLLAGTVEGTPDEADETKGEAPKGAAAAPAADPAKANVVKPQSIRAYLRAGDGEIPLASANIGRDGYFRLRLPTLPEGVSYHLVASGTTASGETVYTHRHDVTKSDPKLTFKLPEAPGAIDVAERSKGPDFTWEAAGSDVSAYRVTLTEIGQDGETLWEGWTTGTSLNLPNHDDFKLLKEGESYRYSLTAIKMEGGKSASDLTELASSAWSSSGMTRPATFEVQRVKPGQRATQALPARTPGKPIAPGAKPAAPTVKPPAGKPSAAPSPKGKRAKPMTDL